MAWRPPIDDPTNNGTIDTRGRCDRCGKSTDDPYTVMGEQLCQDCAEDADV